MITWFGTIILNFYISAYFKLKKKVYYVQVINHLILEFLKDKTQNSECVKGI